MADTIRKHLKTRNMKGIRKFVTKRSLGLDIRSDHASAVLLSTGLKGHKILACDRFDFPAPFYELQPDRLAQALSPILAFPEAAHAAWMISIPARQISFRNVIAPFGERRKIRQMLPFELEPMLLHPVETQIMDFLAVGSSGTGNLIAASAHESDLGKCLQAISAFGIDPELVTAEGFAPAAILAKHFTDAGAFILVDFAGDTAAIFAVADRKIHLIRSCSLNLFGNDLWTSVSVHIRQTQLLFEAIFGIPLDPRTIRITGPGLSLLTDNPPGKLAGVPVEPINLSETFRMSMPHRPWSAHEMDGALALSLMTSEGIKGLNFRQGDFATVHKWMENRKPLIAAGVMAALLLILMLLNGHTETRLLEKRFNALNREIESVFSQTFPEVKRIADPLQQMNVKVEQARKDQLGAVGPSSRLKSIDLLQRISAQIPDSIDVELTRLIISAENVQFTGTTATFNTVNDIKRYLEQLEFFQSVEISSANLDRTGNRVQFKIVADLMNVSITDTPTSWY
jgi:Tfp pilus assembly protein PilN